MEGKSIYINIYIYVSCWCVYWCETIYHCLLAFRSCCVAWVIPKIFNLLKIFWYITIFCAKNAVLICNLQNDSNYVNLRFGSLSFSDEPSSRSFKRCAFETEAIIAKNNIQNAWNIKVISFKYRYNILLL